MKPICLLTTALIFHLFGTGCAVSSVDPAGSTAHHEVFGTSREGRPITGTIIGSGPETYVLLGVVHGNEPLGAPLLQRFTDLVLRDPSLARDRRLVVIPVVNPDGLNGRRRTNAKGVDLNRNFPSSNWTQHPRHGTHPASEPETRTVLRVLRQFQPTRILAIHSPLHCVNYDGPADALAARMSRAIDYPLRPSIGYATPGSLGSYAGVDLNTPTITLELRRGLREGDAWSEARDGLLAFVGGRTDSWKVATQAPRAVNTAP